MVRKVSSAPKTTEIKDEQFAFTLSVMIPKGTEAKTGIKPLQNFAAHDGRDNSLDTSLRLIYKSSPKKCRTSPFSENPIGISPKLILPEHMRTARNSTNAAEMQKSTPFISTDILFFIKYLPLFSFSYSVPNIWGYTNFMFLHGKTSAVPQRNYGTAFCF